MTITTRTSRTIANRADRIHFGQWKRANDSHHRNDVPLTNEQQIAASYGHPGLTPDEACFYVHESEVYPREAELRNLDALPCDWERDGEQQDREARREYALARQCFGGRMRNAARKRLRVAQATAYGRYCAGLPF